MAKKLSYERYAWFHGRVKAGAFPNSAHLADHFEISRKQAQRDVAFMRDRIGAPLLYNADRRGYGYEDGNYELPPPAFLPGSPSRNGTRPRRFRTGRTEACGCVFPSPASARSV